MLFPLALLLSPSREVREKTIRQNGERPTPGLVAVVSARRGLPVIGIYHVRNIHAAPDSSRAVLYRVKTRNLIVTGDCSTRVRHPRWRWSRKPAALPYFFKYVIFVAPIVPLKANGARSK